MTIETAEVTLDHVLEADPLHTVGHALEEDRTVADLNLENTPALDPEVILVLEVAPDLEAEVIRDREAALGLVDHVLEEKVALEVEPNHGVLDLTNPGHTREVVLA